MRYLPDVLGMELHDAKALLEAEGLAFDIAETKPPRKELADGTLRVIKSKLQTQTIGLTVCRI